MLCKLKTKEAGVAICKSVLGKVSSEKYWWNKLFCK